MIRRLILLAAFLAVFTARPAHAIVEAGEAYVYPSFYELIQTAVLLGGVDIQQPVILDEYIRLMYCDLYKENSRDDFVWVPIRKQIAARITSKVEYSRALYQLVGSVKLGEYDFENQRFPLVDRTGFQNVGRMVLFTPYDVKPYCTDPAAQNKLGKNFNFPQDIDLILSQPFTMMYFKMPPDEASKMLDRLRRMKIENRKLYIRFRFRIQSVITGDPSMGIGLHFGGSTVGVDLYYDRDLTMWVGSVPL